MSGNYRGPGSSAAAEAVNQDGDKGDITVSGAGESWTIDDGVVTYGKIQNVSTTDVVLGRSSADAGNIEEIPCTAAGRAIIAAADVAAQRTALELGSIATQSAANVIISGGEITGITDLTIADGGTGASSAADARTNLGLAIGTNVQAFDATLTGLSTLDTSLGAVEQTGIDTFTKRAIGTSANNLVALDATAKLPAVDGSQLTNVGVGVDSVNTAAIQDLAVTTAKIAASNVTSAKLENNISLPGTEAIKLAVGTTAERPASPRQGDVRFNTTINQFEGYSGTAWAAIGGGASGGGSDRVFVENDQTITADYTLTSGRNAHSVGPITINTGVTVTVPTGSIWQVS